MRDYYNLKNNYIDETGEDLQICGLEHFVNELEKHFFATVKVRKFLTDTSDVNLSIELTCNYGIIETLHHYNKGVWGKFSSETTTFTDAIQLLEAKNDLNIAIDELSFFLKDTSIIINRIYHQSIPDQFDNIITEISAHFIYLTKELTEIPYEIYLPIFESPTHDIEKKIINGAYLLNNSGQDYFSFWGLYFYSDNANDAQVYDLKKQSIVKGNLQMLNR